VPQTRKLFEGVCFFCFQGWGRSHRDGDEKN